MTRMTTMMLALLCLAMVPASSQSGGVKYAALSTAEKQAEFTKALSLILSLAAPGAQPDIRARTVKNYETAKPNKALVIQRGLQEFWRTENRETVEETVETALEGCQMRFNKPCALVATNDEIVAGDLADRDMSRLAYNHAYDPAEIPSLRSSVRKSSNVAFYFNAMKPKAMAIHPWGRVFVSAGLPTIEENKAAALKACNDDPSRAGKDGPCFLYAVNTQVVLPERMTVP